MVADCYCPEEFYKDSNGQCAEKSTCAPPCDGDLVFQESGEDCICDSNKNLVCTTINIAQCYCPEGYYKDSNGNCALKSDCTGVGK